MNKLQDFFIKTVLLLSQKSNCVSKKVGAIIVKDNRIISMGYNGTPSGFENCNKHFDENNFNREEHHIWSNTYESHAELSCLLFAVKSGINISNSEMYVTMHPCDQCIKNIIQSGIRKIYYLYQYDKSIPGNELLKIIEIECLLTPEIENFIIINELKKLH